MHISNPVEEVLQAISSSWRNERFEGPQASETLNERRQIFFYSSTQLDPVPFAEGTREE